MTNTATQITVLSYGAGQDSHTILTKLVEDPAWTEQYVTGQLLVIFADTENEHPHTYSHIEKAKAYCADHGILFAHLGSDYRAESWKGGLVYQWETGNRIGSKAYPKSCTDKLKVQPIYKWIAEYLEQAGHGPAFRKGSLYNYTETHGKIRVLIGIAAGEEKRVSKAAAPSKWQRECVQIQYPLIDHNMDRAACQSYLTSMESQTGIPCPMPSNCMFCPFNEGFDLVWMHRNHPESLAKWIQLEENKLEAGKAATAAKEAERASLIASDREAEADALLIPANLGVWGKEGVTLENKLAEALEEFGHMSDAELHEYKFSHGHCVASAY